jgi:AraC-like DNA-binding protein
MTAGEGFESTERAGPPSWSLHPRLAGLVEGILGYSYEPGEMTAHRGMPSTSLTVVLALGRPLDVGWLDRPATQQEFWTVASGFAVGAAHIVQQGWQEGISLSLTPAGARAVFGVPAAALRDTMVPFEELIGRAPATALYEEVASADGWLERYAALERHLLRLVALHEAAVPRPEVAHAWEALTGPTTTRIRQVTEVADSVGWSRRHLGEQFRAETGISPKDARRLARFGCSHLLARDPARSLADIAIEAGYADQPHLTREWRELCGYTPREWRAAELSLVQDVDS